jgi:phosphinothricin acetyltransferase
MRPAAPGDAAELLSIYRPIVEKTVTSFELECPSEKEFARRIETANAAHAWLTAEIDGKIAGYAYATAHRARAAYKYSAETSAYVHEDFRGQGVGGGLYRRLLDELSGLGYCNAFAGITLPNPASVALHESVGFVPIGTFPRVGYKFGSWRDVGWWHRPIRGGDGPQ